MYCFISLKKCEKWWQTRVLLKKAGEGGVIDLDVPLGTSVGRTMGKKKAKAAATQAASSERVKRQMAGVGHNASRHSSGKGERKVGVHHGEAREEDRAQDDKSGGEEKEERFHDLDRGHIEHGRVGEDRAHALLQHHLARNGTTSGNGEATARAATTELHDHGQSANDSTRIWAWRHTATACDLIRRICDMM
jgi:hypothetical protein